MKLFLERTDGISYKKLHNGKYELATPIKLFPTKKFLTEKELESIYRCFDKGIYIKIKEEK